MKGERRIKTCGGTCHNAKGTKCLCWCGGHFHGAAGAINREALSNIKDEPEKLEYLAEHGFMTRETKYKQQTRMNLQTEGNIILLPPIPDVCQVCARKHDCNAPHDLTSLYYQSRFILEHQRPPNWLDAMAHCDKETKNVWIKELTKMGIKIE
jgi:hypothetical protein